MIVRLYLIGILCLPALVLSAQSPNLRGKVVDKENSTPVSDAAVVLSGTGKFSATNKEGVFEISGVNAGNYQLVVTRAGFLPYETAVEVLPQNNPVVQISLQRDPNSDGRPVEIPTITLDEAEEESEGAGEVANLLHASRDVFQTISGFGWSTFRFRERGYDSEFFPIYLNGIPINDPESGIAFFGEFGGLNDVLRNRESTIGLDAADFAFTEVGGGTLIDTRASVQRKQVRASYAISNRTYNNRVMLTANTGLMPGGWAISLSGSRRWAQEGWHDGSFFDGYAWFMSVDKKFGDKHLLNLTVLGSPNHRGRVGDTFQEMFDLAGTTRYNPNWGYWNGEKRNAYVSHSNQPIALLRYDWKPSDETTLMLAAYAQGGVNGYTRLDWFNAYSPEPDYNRRLPSGYPEGQQEAWAQQMRENESLRQIDWVKLWQANETNTESIANANGIAGNTVTGKRSQYIVADFRGDSKEGGFNAVLSQIINKRVYLNAGANYTAYLGRNFKTVDDILGGDYIVDWDKYALQDIPGNPSVRDNDLRTPNHVVREGETFGFDYDENIRKAGAFFQLQGNLRRFSWFAGGENRFTQFWRTGNMQNGRYPDESLGDSEKQTYYTYGVKAGLTYKINGRNFLYVNGMHGTRAPLFRDIFLSPRIRNQVLDNTKPYTIQSAEAGYQLRAPNYRARLTGYYTTYAGEYDNYLVYASTQGVFGSLVMRNIERRHAGVEMAIEAKPIVGWTVTAAANLGQYIYTSRPSLYLTLDNTSEVILDGVTAYLKNFYVPRTPQKTAALGIKYDSRRFWFASLTLNWADEFWYQFDATRRTAGFVEPFERGTDLWHLIIDQQKAPAAFSLDFFGGKSWRIRQKNFINLTVGVNNILNNLNIVTSGRDAYRNAYQNDLTDPRLYSSQITYAPGTNYFISIAVRRQ